MAGENDVLSRLPVGGQHITRRPRRNGLDLTRIVGLAQCLPAGNGGDRVGGWPGKGILDTRPEPSRNG